MFATLSTLFLTAELLQWKNGSISKESYVKNGIRQGLEPTLFSLLCSRLLALASPGHEKVVPVY